MKKTKFCLKKIYDCCICYEKIKVEGVIDSCSKHKICFSCLRKWIIFQKNEFICPFCKSPFRNLIKKIGTKKIKVNIKDTQFIYILDDSEFLYEIRNVTLDENCNTENLNLEILFSMNNLSYMIMFVNDLPKIDILKFLIYKDLNYDEIKRYINERSLNLNCQIYDFHVKSISLKNSVNEERKYYKATIKLLLPNYEEIISFKRITSSNESSFIIEMIKSYNY